MSLGNETLAAALAAHQRRLGRAASCAPWATGARLGSDLHCIVSAMYAARAFRGKLRMASGDCLWIFNVDLSHFSVRDTRSPRPLPPRSAPCQSPASSHAMIYLGIKVLG
jgi:hypothetical protein